MEDAYTLNILSRIVENEGSDTCDRSQGFVGGKIIDGTGEIMTEYERMKTCL